MAKDVITRFKLESNQFDSALKRASKELTDFSKTATQSGKGFNDFTKKNIEAARALGNTATSSTNAKDKLRELTQAFNETARAYNALSKEQKQSDFAQALAGSLTQLQQRIRETKAEMQSLSNVSMPNISAGAGGSDPFAGLTGKFTMGNLYAQAAMTGVEAVEQLGQKIVDVTKRGMDLSVQAEGIQHAFDRLNKPNLLDNLKEATHGTVSELNLMKAAVQFNNFKLPVEELGTMLAFAQQKAKDTGQSVDYMVDSIVTGLGRKSLMILDNLGLSAAQIKEKMKETGDMTKAVGEIIREEMANAGDYVETASDRMARAMAENEDALRKLGDQMRETFGDTTWEEFTTNLSTEWVKAESDIIRGLDKISGYLPVLIGLKEAFKAAGVESEDMFSNIVDWAMVCTGPLGTVIELIRQIGKESKTAGDYLIQSAQSIINATVNAVLPFGRHQTTNTPITIPKTGGKSGGGGKTTLSPSAQAAAMMAKAEKDYHNALANAQEKVNVGLMTEEELQKTKLKLLEQLAEKNLAAWNTSGLDKYLSDFTNFANAAVDLRQKLMSVDDVFKQLEKDFPTVLTSGTASQSFAESMQSAFAGDKGFGNEEKTSNLIQNIIKKGLENGVDMSDEGSKLMEMLFEGMDVPDDALQEFVDKVNDKLKKSKFKIHIDPKTGELTQGKEANITQEVSKIAGGLNQVIGGLNSLGIEIPKGIANVVNGIQSITTILGGIATTVMAIQTLATADFFKLFSGGGIVHAASGFMVPGNNFSGDRVPALLNSGEVVLNKAQQGNLVSQLTENPMGGMGLETVITAEDIRVVLNNNGRRTGYGEYVQTRR